MVLNIEVTIVYPGEDLGEDAGVVHLPAYPGDYLQLSNITSILRSICLPHLSVVHHSLVVYPPNTYI